MVLLTWLQIKKLHAVCRGRTENVTWIASLGLTVREVGDWLGAGDQLKVQEQQPQRAAGAGHTHAGPEHWRTTHWEATGFHGTRACG